MKKQMESLSLRWEKEFKPFAPIMCPPPVQNCVPSSANRVPQLKSVLQIQTSAHMAGECMDCGAILWTPKPHLRASGGRECMDYGEIRWTVRELDGAGRAGGEYCLCVLK